MPRALSAAISPRRQRKNSNHKAFAFWIDSGPNDDNFSWHKADLSNVREGSKMRNTRKEQIISALPLPAQPVDPTQALNLSAGVSNCKVSRGLGGRRVI